MRTEHTPDAIRRKAKLIELHLELGVDVEPLVQSLLDEIGTQDEVERLGHSMAALVRHDACRDVLFIGDPGLTCMLVGVVEVLCAYAGWKDIIYIYIYIYI